MHKMTLQQMWNLLNRMNQPIEDKWELPNKNFDKNILLATILHKYADLPVVQDNPMLFKYQSDIWFAKHFRTFYKWFDAFDIPYSPLENYNRKEERVEKTQEYGNQYHRYKNTDNVDLGHIEHNTSNKNTEGKIDLFNNEEEEIARNNSGTKGAFVNTDTNSGSNKNQTSKDDETNSITKNSGTDEEWNETIITDRASDIDTVNKETNLNVNTSGRLIPQYDAQGHIIGYNVEADSERSIENGVSAFDEGTDSIRPFDSSNYSPSSIAYTNGSMTDNGSKTNTQNVKTNNAPGANREKTTKDGEKHTDYHEGVDGTVNKNGTITEDITNNGNEQTTSNEITQGKDNTKGVKYTTENQISTGKDNIEEESESKDKTEELHKGESTQNTSTDRESTILNFLHGNIGVTTSQQMLEAEIRVQLFSIYDQMAELYVDENCIPIFIDNFQRGYLY